MAIPRKSVPTRVKPIQDDDTPQAAPNIFSEGGNTFRTMGRRDTAFVLITNQVGLGILCLPSILQTLGLIPGLIAILGIGLVSTYTAYELLQFYNRYPSVVNIVDMAKIVGGRPLEVIVAICLLVKLCLTCSSACVTLSVAFNTLSDHGMCTIGWIGVAVVICYLLCLPRTFKFVAHVGIPSTISILVAVLIVMISLGVADPKGAPPEGFTKEIILVGRPGFKKAVTACLNVCYAFAGNIGFVSYMAEMKNPKRDFTPALIVLQIFSIPLYLTVATVIYCLAGQHVSSPALGSAPEIPAKIAYGIALPAIISTGIVFGHTAIKFMFVAIMRGLNATGELTSNSPLSWSVWVGSATVFWIAAFIISNAIPIFDSILAISAATFVAWFTFGISAVFWFYLNWHRLFMNWKKTILTVINVLIIMQSLFMNGAGLWAAITSLMDVFHYKEGNIKGAFTCADNSIF